MLPTPIVYEKPWEAGNPTCVGGVGSCKSVCIPQSHLLENRNPQNG